MADEKISAMPAAAALTGPELVPLVQGSANVKGTAANVAALGNAFATAAAASAVTTAEAYTDAQLAAAGTIAPQAILLPNGKVPVGNGSNHGTAVNLSGAITIDNAGVATLSTNLATRQITIPMSGGGAVIPTGIQADGQIEYECDIISVTMLADQVGSMVVDLWVDSYANYPPTIADSICGGALPTISAANKSTDAVLTGWTGKHILAGSTIRPNINSCSSIQRCTLILNVVARP